MDPENDEGLHLVKLAQEQHPEEWARFIATGQALQWLCVLAAPHLLQAMSRVPPRDHLLRMVDVLIDYAHSGERCTKPDFDPVPYERREPLARELRALIEAWTPPDVPQTITEAARAVLHAEGRLGPGGDWNKLENDGEEPLEDVLLWPEGVPAILRRQAGNHD